MTPGSGKDTVQRSSDVKTQPNHFSFPQNSTLETDEQIRRFELLRLAFFVLKLRKIEQRLKSLVEPGDVADVQDEQRRVLDERCNLLRHVIFQQVLTLTKLNAREQALQIIDTCRS